MQNLLNTYLNKFKKERKARNRLLCVMFALAVFVGTGVYWQLRMTGAALTNEAFCGMEEHTHTEECMEEVLVCEEEASAEEASAEGHEHTEECYELQQTCELEEHVHTIDCLSDESADVENASDWEMTIPALSGNAAEDVIAVAKSQLGYSESTKNFVLDEDGETRMGYTRYGAWYGNAYGDWDGMFAAFVYYYAEIPISDFPVAAGANTWAISLNNEEKYIQEEGYVPTEGDAVFFDRLNNDQIADHVGVVIYVDEERNTIAVVEGNSNDAVESNEYALDDYTILGYGILIEKEETEEEEKDSEEDLVSEEEKKEVSTSTTFETENGYVSAKVELTDALPEDYTFVAKVVEEDSKEYSNALELAADFIEDENISITSAFVVDMHFLNESGVETEITGSADITLSFLQDVVSKSNDARVLHMKDDGTVEDVTGQILFTEDQSAVEEATLTTTSFSNFTIVSLQNSGMINLVDYIEKVKEQGQSASVTVEVYNTDDTKVERTKDGDGNDVITVTEDDNYQLSLLIHSSAGFSNGTYAYELPEGVNLEAGKTGSVVSNKGEKLGTWTVEQDTDSGRFYFKIEIEQGETQFTNVDVQFTEDATFNRQANNKILGDATLIVNPKNPDSSVTVKKSSDRENGIYSINGGVHDGTVWTATFEQSNSSLVGTKFADILEDSSSNFMPVYVQYSNDLTKFKTYLDGRTTLPGNSTFAHFDLDQSASKGKYKNIVIKVTNSNGDYYEWAVDWTSENGDLARFYRNETGKLDKQTFYDYIAGNYTWDSSKEDDIVGFEYLFPSIVNKSNALWVNSYINGTLDDSGNAVFNLSDTASWDNYTVEIKTNVVHDVLPSLDTGNGGIPRLVYYNSGYVRNTNGTSDSVSQYFVQQVDGGSGIVKTVDRGSDGSVDWKVTANLPGGKNIPFQISDRMIVVYKDSSGKSNTVDISQAEYAENIVIKVNIPVDTTINGQAVSKGSYMAYDISDPSKIPADAKFVYRYHRENDTTSYANYTLGMVCQCDDQHCSDWDSTAGACQANMTTSSSGTQYCACWTMNTRVTVDLTYTTPADKVRELNDTYGIFTGAVFRNYGTLYTGKYTGKDNGLTNRNWLWSSNTEVNLSLIGKALTGTPVYNADDDPDNDYIAQYTITVNSDHNPLVPAGSTSPITITDTLSDALTMKVTERYPFVVKAYEDASDKEGRVLTSGDYTINYDVSPASFKIEIPNPGTRKYVISYYAEILNPQMDLPYSNTATLSWEGKDQTVQTSVARLLNVTTTGETYAVSLRKVSDTNEPLAGAVFGLYDASGKEMASGTTDTTGNLTFKTIAGTGDDALVLEPYTLYYLQEKEAPTGYIRNEKKYYFSFRKYGNTDAEHTAAQKIFVESIPESIDQNDYTLIANVPLQISNEAKKYEFTLKKVDADNTETVLTNAEFILYRSRGTEGSNEYEYALLKDGTITGWTSYKNNATSITVGQNGLAEVKGITFGTYYLEEKKAPDGYNLLTEDVEIVVSLEGNITTTSADAFVSTNNNVTTLTVKNNVGYELPKTGGIGTQGYTFLGLILALAAGMLLLIRRRTNN